MSTELKWSDVLRKAMRSLPLAPRFLSPSAEALVRDKLAEDIKKFIDEQSLFTASEH